jgi:hypothetical protein
MLIQTQEARIILAIEAIRTSKNLSCRLLQKFIMYLILHFPTEWTVAPLFANDGQQSQNVCIRRLSDYSIYTRYGHKGICAPTCRCRRYGELYPRISRSKTCRKALGPSLCTTRPELKTRFTRVYDFQGALYEDPELIGAWFRLVENVRSKYGVLDRDFYNFDETGFMIGQICPGMVVTRADRHGRGKRIQPGNREWGDGYCLCYCNGEGWDLPPFLVVKGVNHLSNWITETDLPSQYVVKPTNNG